MKTARVECPLLNLHSLSGALRTSVEASSRQTQDLIIISGPVAENLVSVLASAARRLNNLRPIHNSPDMGYC